MANGSNRTDRGSLSRAVQQTRQQGSVANAVQAAQDLEPSISRAVETASAADSANQRPGQMPLERDPGEDFLEEVQGFGQQALERTAEFPLTAARGFLALPAGAERLLHAGIEEAGVDLPDIVEVGDLEVSTKPFQDLVARTETAQDIVREYFGNDENQFVDFVGEIAGGYVTANQLFRAAPQVSRFIANRFSPALFRPITGNMGSANALSKLPQTAQSTWARFVAGSLDDAAAQSPQASQALERLTRTAAAGVEGGLFTAGLPDTDRQDILIGTAAGLGLQGGAEAIGAGFRRFLQSKAQKAFPERVEQIRQIARGSGDVEIEGFPEFLGRIDSNLQLGSQYGQTSDEAVASIKATLSEQGETGAIGAVRGLTDLTEEQVTNLREAFPNYRFHVTGRVRGDVVSDQKLLFGLKPDVEVPSGTREAPSLTDKVIDDFRQSGLLRNQRVLVDGHEHRFLSAAPEGDRVLVKPLDRGQPYPVEKSRVAPLDDHVGLLKNDRLLQQFRQFRAAEQFEDFDRGFDEFADRFLEDMDPSLRPHLKKYFEDQEQKFIAQRVRPDERRAVERFRQARKKAISEGQNSSLETLAASRAHVTHRMSDGRVKVTNMITGQTRGPFRNADKAEGYLRNLETVQPDVAPKIEGVPDNLLEGMATPAARPNPGHPPKAELESQGIMERIGESAEGFSNWWTRHVTPRIGDMEAAARRMEERGVIDAPIWSEAMQPLSRDLRIVQNRSKPFAERLSRIFRGVDESEQDLIEGWLRSEQKATFEDAHDMPERLVSKAEDTRVWLEDTFNEWTAATGVDLSAEDWMRNYAPDLIDYTSQTGRTDVDDLFRRAGADESIPNEVEFFSEMWKAGEATELPQEPLASKLSRMLRSGMFKAHAGESFDDAVRFATERLDDSPIAKRHLNQYLNGARGRIDFVRERLNEIADDFYAEVGGVQAKDSRNLIDAMIDQTYGGLIAFRPGLVLRNLFQPQLMGGPILGNRRIARAQVDALKPEFQEWAARVGILERREAVTFFEEIGEEAGAFEGAPEAVGSLLRMNRRARSLGLRPYSAADKHNRVATALATRRSLENSLPKFRAGELNETELLEESGLWVLDGPQRQKFFNILGGADIEGTVGQTADERAVNFAADEIGSKLVNFLYGSRNAPAWMRTTPGRVFGAYSTWPRGYLNYLTQLTSADARVGTKLKALAKHGALNAGILAAGTTAGVNLASWVQWNSLFFGGSPALDIIENARKVWAGMPWEREEAARQLRSAPARQLLPGGQILFGDLPTALERLNQGDTFKAAAEAAGFRTIREGESAEDVIRQGLTPTPLQVPQGQGGGGGGIGVR